MEDKKSKLEERLVITQRNHFSHERGQSVARGKGDLEGT